ncbi:MAG: hypothetical protein AAF438_20825 [Pseudomonadota bacterium]
MREPVYLNIENGVHARGVHLLDPDSICVVGSGDQTDVQLFDEQLAEQHVGLSINAQGVSVKALGASCTRGSKQLEPGHSAILSHGDEVTLTPSDVRLSLHTGADESTPGRGQLWFAATLCALLLMGIWLTWANDQTPGALEPTLQQSVQQLLQDLDPDEPIVVELDVNTAKLTGTLGDELHQRLSDLTSTREYIVNQTLSSSNLIAQVDGVFRTNGYAAKLHYRGSGVVLVNNLDPDNPKVQRVAAYVQRDVPGVTKLEFAPFERAPEKLALPAFPLDPNKRLTTIVDGDTAYVATTDGARYFEGSVLPNGQKIRKITAQGIQVDHHGELVWLQL